MKQREIIMGNKVKFIDNRFFKVNGVTEGEFEPSRGGCYVSVFVMQVDGTFKTICIARFAKYGGRAAGLAEAKRWLKAAFARYSTGTELYKALQEINPESGMSYSPAQLIPVPPARHYQKQEITVRPIQATRVQSWWGKCVEMERE
jgi:hypothetical protein